MCPFGLSFRNSAVRVPPPAKLVGTFRYSTPNSSNIHNTRNARDAGIPYRVTIAVPFRGVIRTWQRSPHRASDAGLNTRRCARARSDAAGSRTRSPAPARPALGYRARRYTTGRYRFSVISRAIFQDTKNPLKIWLKIGYLMLTAEKGLSSLQVRPVIFGENSGTCSYMCHR